MNQPEPQSLPNLELIGQLPPLGGYWCATCAQMYLGAVSEDSNLVEIIRELMRKTMERGDMSVNFKLPDIPAKPLRCAVTIAPSVYFAYPAPVCWVHMIPYSPQMQAAQAQANGARTSLIPGKHHNWRGGQP